MDIHMKSDPTAHCSSLLKYLQDFKFNKQFCDFVVKVGLEEIQAHRIILAAKSNYFRAMLSHDTLERNSGSVEMVGVDAECVRKCIEYMYTGTLDLGSDKCGELVNAAHILLMSDICELIAKHYKENFEVSSFLEVKNLADFYSCTELKDACNEGALDHLDDFMTDDQFSELDHNYAVSLLLHERFTEATKYRNLIKWANIDVKERKEIFEHALCGLWPHKMPLSNCMHMFESEPIVNKSMKIIRRFALYLLGDLDAQDLPEFEHDDANIFDKLDAELGQVQAKSEGVEGHRLKDVLAKLSPEDRFVLYQTYSTQQWFNESPNRAPMHFLAKNLRRFAARREFYQYTEPRCLAVLLSLAPPSVCENEKLKICINWARCNTVNRQHNFAMLVKYLDISKMDRRCLRFLLENEPLFSMYADFFTNFIRRTLSLSGIRAVEPSFECEKNGLMVFGDTLADAQIYACDSETWGDRLRTLPIACDSQPRNFSVVFSCHGLYAIYDRGIVKYDSIAGEEAKWVPHIQTFWRVDSFTEMNGFLYLAGSQFDDLETYNDSVGDRFDNDFFWVDLKAKTIIEIEVDDVNFLRYKTSIIASNGCVYALGGVALAYDDGGFASLLNDVRKYDPARSEWSRLSPMNVARAGAAVATRHNKIYAFGSLNENGQYFSNDAECYDILTGSWTIILPPSVKRVPHIATIIRGRIYLVGQKAQAREVTDGTDVEVCDMAKKSWINIKHGATTAVATETPLLGLGEQI